MEMPTLSITIGIVTPTAVWAIPNPMRDRWSP